MRWPWQPPTTLSPLQDLIFFLSCCKQQLLSLERSTSGTGEKKERYYYKSNPRLCSSSFHCLPHLSCVLTLSLDPSWRTKRTPIQTDKLPLVTFVDTLFSSSVSFFFILFFILDSVVIIIIIVHHTSPTSGQSHKSAGCEYHSHHHHNHQLTNI